ncbi:MAG TPA: PspC domain-containing protein, partial [Pseudonocardia sp.]|nr:PspC domain-containing protein [Pseudonocardia sp.]
PLPAPPSWEPPAGASWSPPAGAGSGFRLRRSRTNRMLGGVCGALAEDVGVDAALLRIGLVVLTVLGFGLGAVAYVAAWVLAPVRD